MPGLSGLDLCGLISRKQGYVNTILLSANGEQGECELGAARLSLQAVPGVLN
jgi:hypothetical protein